MSDESGRRDADDHGARHRGRLLAIAITTGIVIAAAAFFAGRAFHDGDNGLPVDIRQPLPTVLLRRQILKETLRLAGVVSAPSGFSVNPLTPPLPDGAAPLVLTLPATQGSKVTDGTVLADIAGSPLIAMQGAIPMYRNLACGERGPDVAEYQAGLERVGYPITDESGFFGPSTAIATADLFVARGFLAPTMSPMPACGLRRKVKESLSTVPSGDIVFIPSLPGYVAHVGTHVGARLGSSVMTVATGVPVVSVALTSVQASIVSVGMQASLAASRAIHASVTRVVPRSGGATATLSVRPGTRLPGIGSSVAVAVTIIRLHRPVWTVPISAVRTSLSGRSYIEVRERNRLHRIAIRVGQSVAGVVAVYPRGDNRFTRGDEAVVGG